MLGCPDFSTKPRLSKLELQRELEAAPIVQRVGDLAESRRSKDQIRIVELRSVKEVDRFGAERGLPIGSQPPGPHQCGVHVADAASSKGIGAQVSSGTRWSDVAERRTRQ